MKRMNGKFHSEEMLRDRGELKKFGFNGREINFLAENPWTELKSLYFKPYLDKFTDEYQPFQLGYDEWDKIPASDIYKKDGASKAALGEMGGEPVVRAV